MPFANSVVGGTALVRPAINSPNFSQAGQTGWAIDRNGNAFFYSVTVSGNVIVASATGGVFVYSGAPALGNLIGSWAGTAGIDSVGNGYPQGLSVDTGVLAGVAISGTSISLDPGPLLLYGNTNQVVVNFPTTASGPFVPPAGVTSLDKVECWGGGGGRDAAGSGGAGGGGGYSINTNVAVTPLNSYTTTVGTGGAAGSGGNPTTLIGDAVTTTGHGGGPGSGTTGGGGGAGTFAGGAGGNGGASSGGGGGSSAGTSQAGNAGKLGSAGGLGGLAPVGGGAGGNGGEPGPGLAGQVPGGGGGGGASGGQGAAGQMRITYTITGGALSLIASIAAVAGTDLATGTAYPGPGVGLASTTAPAKLAGFSALYGAGGQAATVNPAGLAVNLSGGQLATVSGFTAVTAAALSTLASFTIPAGDAASIGVIYRLTLRGSGTFGSTAASNVLTLQTSLGAVSLGSAAIGSTFTAISTGFRWRIVIEAIPATLGSGGTWLGGLSGEISVTGANLLPAVGANASMGLTAGVAAAQAASTLTAQVLALQASWAATTGAPTLICTSAYPQRIA